MDGSHSLLNAAFSPIGLDGVAFAVTGHPAFLAVAGVSL
jgi:hypothetical protein